MTPTPTTGAVMSHDQEKQLPAMVQDLDDAVYDLTKVQTHRQDDGGTFTSPSLYVQMQEAVHGVVNGSSGVTAFRSKPPLWIDGIDWIYRIEKKVREWLPNQYGHTLTLLLALPEHNWTPSQVDEVGQIAHTIRGWVKQAEAMLGEESTLEVKKPCPECGQRYIYRTHAGETIRQPALTVSTKGARCLHCGHEWGSEYLEFLATLLGEESVDEKHKRTQESS